MKPNNENNFLPNDKNEAAGLSKADVDRKIHRGFYDHRVEKIGTPGRPYVTRYHLNLDVRTMATEIRIYADDTRKCHVQADLNGDVTYARGDKNDCYISLQ